MHIERVSEKIVTVVLVAGAAAFSTVCAEFLSRPDNRSRGGGGDISGSLLKPPGSETVQRSSASHYERLKIPLPPFQK